MFGEKIYQNISSRFKEKNPTGAAVKSSIIEKHTHRSWESRGWHVSGFLEKSVSGRVENSSG